MVFDSTRLLAKFNGYAQIPERCMMATAAIIGLSAGKRILGTSFYSSDLADMLFPVTDHGPAQFSTASTRSVIVARRSSHFSTTVPVRQLKSIWILLLLFSWITARSREI